MNGDMRPDLVIYQEHQGSFYRVPNSGVTYYWKVYAGNNSGFSATAITWNLPTGGYALGSTNFSFLELERNIGDSYDNDGSQLWQLQDIDGDLRPDLVIYQEKQSGFYRVPRNGNNYHWRVYKGYSNGFNNTAFIWGLPTGGYSLGSTNFSFLELERGIGDSYDNDGSQLWALRDMNGDLRPDLVVYQEKQNGFYRVLRNGNDYYWKVHLNTGMNSFTAQENDRHYITIYPNPSTGIFYIEGVQKTTTAQIFSLQGQLIQELIINPDNQSITLSNVSKGVYFLCLDNDDTTTIKRLIVE
jgi:hypothetical protein